MLREMTIGQYYEADSILHRLDPRVKLAGVLVYIVALFVFDNVAGYVLSALFLAAMIALSKVPVKFIFKGLKTILVLLLLTVVFNLFLVSGDVIWRLWKLTITRQGVETAVKTAIRLIFLIFGSSLLTLTTTPNQLTDGIEKGLSPLAHLRVPVHELAMMMSIALRFIPILLEETDKIMKAQMARGADFESGGLLQKMKNMVPLLVPLFVSAFRRANDLALAMEARCYRGGAGRTKMKPLVYRRRDAVAYIVLLLYVAVGIVLRLI